MTADKTSAVLDRMVSDVVNRKQSRTPKAADVPQETFAVTPVVPLEVTGSVTQARDSLLDSLARIESEVASARFHLELLFQPLRQVAVTTPASIEAARKQAEAEADQRAFERDQMAKASAAMSAAFNEPSVLPTASDWLCPDHGKSTWTTSPKGRNYLRCPVDGCGEFERAR